MEKKFIIVANSWHAGSQPKYNASYLAINKESDPEYFLVSNLQDATQLSTHELAEILLGELSIDNEPIYMPGYAWEIKTIYVSVND